MPLPLRLLGPVALLAFLVGACGLMEGAGAAHEHSRSTIVEARVLAAPEDPTPVGGVIMIIEPDPGSERPFRGPDQSFMSDERGWIRAEVLAGEGAGSAAGEGAHVFDAAPAGESGDVCVHFLHAGSLSSRCGVTLQAGGVLERGDQYLSQFALLPGEGSD